MNLKTYKLTLVFVFFSTLLFGQKTEDDYYKIVTLPIPEGIELEVGGLAVMPNGSLAACTRRGEVWIVDNPYMFDATRPTFSKFAEGLHEPLGLAYIDGNLWATQRGEVTILKDNDKNGKADEFEQFYKWPLSGNYHQYSYGPVPLPDGEMLFTLNLDWIGKGASQSKWRGWMFKLDKDANMTPWATGLRSPAGFNVNNEGDIFYAENQGDWVGSGRVTHLDKGDFAGNPAGLKWSGEPNSPVKLKPEDIPDTGEPLYEVALRTPGLKAPAVWFPHTLMGISTADIVQDNSNGAFGPFEGQYFVGDQGHSKVMRMQLEKVDGVYQGACYPFREGFQSGILRMRWGLDNSMFVGQTSRGWAATGKDKFGIQRMVWTGDIPFEIKSITSASDGFNVAFTQKVDRESVLNPASFDIQSFNYKYHHTYGSPIINQRKVNIKAMKLADDGMSVHIAVDSIRLGYIFAITAEGVMNAMDEPLLHNVGYFTLNRINSAVESIDINKYAVKAPMDHSLHQTAKVYEVVSTKRVNTMPADWNGEVDQTIIIGTKPGLKYDTEKVSVKAGSRIKITFNNNDDMLHNMLIVKPNSVDKVGQAAFELGLKAEEKGFVPDLDEVLYHTGLLQPESTESIYFTAPLEKGNYTFVCTFPGHYTLMQGVIRVR